MTLRGADFEVVRAALTNGDPLPGTRGFAGEVDGRLVRDVLGREPLFVEGDSTGRSDPADSSRGDGEPPEWSFSPDELDDPVSAPAGSVHDGSGWQHVWDLPGADPADQATALKTLSEAVDAALEDVAGDPPVAFSGGVDSALVATTTSGPAYVAGFPDSHDVAAAREAATEMDRELRVVEVDHETLRRAAIAVATATGRTNAMDVSIAATLYLVARRAAEDGFDQLLLGQGADELFGGYAKVEKAPEDGRVAADTVLGARDEVLSTLPDQLERDVLAIRAAGAEPVVPLLDDRVVRAALGLPESLLVADGRRKVGLRRVARDRVPASVADRDKKALQYGSLVSRELDRLARQAGYKRRMDDHVRRYVEHLLDEEGHSG